MRKQQAEMVYGKEMTVLDKERTIAYERAKAFKSKNPFIVSFMHPSYISRPHYLVSYPTLLNAQLPYPFLFIPYVCTTLNSNYDLCLLAVHTIEIC